LNPEEAAMIDIMQMMENPEAGAEYVTDNYLYDYHNDLLIMSTTESELLVAYNLFDRDRFKT
jgi:hypothetical protein